MQLGTNSNWVVMTRVTNPPIRIDAGSEIFSVNSAARC